MNRAQDIIDYIRKNRVSTTEIADALGKSGVVTGAQPVTPDHFRVGRARCIFTSDDSNHDLHEQIKAVKEGEVVLAFQHNCDTRALMGDLISRYILFYRGAEAVVVAGLVRDAARLRRERYPIWARGATPLGCFNTPGKVFPPEEAERLRRMYEGGIAVCDDGGVAVIPPDRLDDDMLERLQRIELQEDVWYYCLNTLKWDTKKIVCDKAYLKETDVVPAPFAKELERLGKPLDARK